MKELILKAADLLEQPGKWTTGAIARDANQCRVNALHERATCWCAIGALIKACGNYEPCMDSAVNLAITHIEKYIHSGVTLHSFNDDQITAESVVALLREAAEHTE